MKGGVDLIQYQAIMQSLQVDASWKDLTHALSGLFCASINFLESSTTYSAPKWTFQSALGSLRYGTLPHKAGLSALMDRPSIYKSFYHSQRLHLTQAKTGADPKNSRVVLEQTLTVVLQPNILTGGTNYSSTATFAANGTNLDDFGRNVGFELSVNPDRVLKEVEKSSSILYEYPIKVHKDSEQFDLGITWKHPVIWSTPHAPLYASRFLMGSGNERGAIAICMKSTRCNFQVNVLQIVPWYIKVYYHTLQLFVDEKPQVLTDFVERMRVSPSEDKVSPGLMELVLKLPCEVKSAVLNIEFDKGFLHIDEYPPDANQGFDIPSAIISFPDFNAGLQFSDNSISKTPMLSKLQERSPVISYTEVLLVPLTTPDFSMPYNVITITCTVFALYFGSLLNALRRRVGEEERCLNDKGNTQLFQFLHPKTQVT
ncbi:hypothetical protein Ahy_B09g095703 isoform A [Arachis hypogaea]|uniref:GPI transamidase component PIG-T n=1 Tax=Arachis hypogaea TaxID=3818 RepID=A0A444XFY8_ARAHY|nr:hypothetical protein Ahy_B09g095703 isoform A [Arachis hypogaea]